MNKKMPGDVLFYTQSHKKSQELVAIENRLQKALCFV
tara:strand:+ start:172 stop:282 length:111 start_codon:yes stop_codon:yes gene_type:complete